MTLNKSSGAIIFSQVADLIKSAKKILFITGAGISADSGIPTYRGIGGLYEKKTTQDGLPIEDALSGFMLKSMPDVTWKYLWQIGRCCYSAKPNRAHEVITQIQTIIPDTWVLTQNIDGLHRKALTKNLIEIHGYAFDLYCIKCNKTVLAKTLFSANNKAPILPPLCSQPQCNGLIRPDIVLFGERLPQDCLRKMNELSKNGVDLIITIGTSNSFPYIIEPVLGAQYLGIPTVEINPCETDISKIVTHHIKQNAAGAMDTLWRYVRSI